MKSKSIKIYKPDFLKDLAFFMAFVLVVASIVVGLGWAATSWRY